MKLAREFAVVVGVDFERGEVNTDGGSVTDGRCTAYLELADCRPDFALCFEAEVFGFVRQLRLINDDEGVLFFIEGEGFHIEDVGSHKSPLFV